MSSQTLLLVDNKDRRIGYDSYENCHTGRGRRHRAFVTLLFSEDNKVLLQKRKHRIFDNLWDLTAISHPLHVDERDETYQEASDRALRKEMGISHVPVSGSGAFNYFAKDGKNCENEYCAVLVGNFDGEYKPNKNEVYEAKKVKLDDFMADVGKNPKKYTPWAIEAVKILKKTNPNLFKAELGKFLESYEPYASAFYGRKIKETARYSPIIANFYKDLANFAQGGKKLRAFFVYLGFKVGAESSRIQGTVLNSILPISFAFEMTQNFFLIHDDIMDNSDLRRSKPTIHKIYEKKHDRHYGESMAMTLGDVAAIEAFKIIGESGFSDKQKSICLQEFSKVLLETGYGQALDLKYSFEKANIAQIYKIADLKTAGYSVIGPLVVGAKLAGAGEGQIKSLTEFGTRVGLAFQLADDILGVFGDEEVIGKSILSDMREGKNTLLIYKTKQLASGSDLQILEKIWGHKAANLKDLLKVRKIVEKCGAFAWCQKENLRLANEAKNYVGGITNDVNLQVLFSQIADFVINRQK